MSGGVAVICGGVGAARLLVGLQQVVPADQLTAIVNVGDDMVLHGLHISPDLDTIMYTVSGQSSVDRGWGLEGESWQAMETLGRYGGADWFALGDRDLGTHLYRTDQLHQGRSLSAVTADMARAWGIEFGLVPVTDGTLRTMVTLADGGEVSFQEYFVGLRHDVAVRSVRFDGAADVVLQPEARAALETAEQIIVAPSNPVVSIDPVLAVPGVAELLQRRRSSVVAVSPIVGGKALKGPAARLMTELGREASALGVARWYRSVIGKLILDTVDGDLAPEVAELGIEPVVADTIMAEPGVQESLARLASGR
jgi:LPPG:FO 2-phospho-L-lactate transferase